MIIIVTVPVIVILIVRRVHAYNTENGEVRYTIDLDEAKFGLEKKPGYLTVEMDGRSV